MNLNLPRRITDSRPGQLLVGLLCLAAIAGLGAVRVSTQAQFTFASLMLLPVLLSAWVAGRTAGWLSAAMAATLWGYADYAAATSGQYASIPFVNALVHLVNYGIGVELVRWVHVLLKREADNARTDKLTGLPNQRGFMDMASQQINSAQRLGTPVAVAFIDLDQFKQLNDTRGHRAGDAALRNVSTMLQQTLRSSDSFGRVGGDEFCVLAFEETPDHAREWARRVHEQLTQALADHKPVGVSIGVAYFEHANTTLADMLQLADSTMYEVKKSGKGTVRVRVIGDDVALESEPPPASQSRHVSRRQRRSAA